MVPPQRRNEKRIAGLELGDAGRGQRILKPREHFEVRVTDLHQAHRRAGRREVERPDVEVGDLFRREQREPAPARHDAGDVVRFVEVGGYRDAVTEPDPRHDRLVEQRQPVLGGKTRQAIGDQRALHGHGRWMVEQRVARQLLEDRRTAANAGGRN